MYPLTVEEVANILSTSKSTVLRLVRAGTLHAVVVKKKLYISTNSVETYMRRNTGPAKPATGPMRFKYITGTRAVEYSIADEMEDKVTKAIEAGDYSSAKGQELLRYVLSEPENHSFRLHYVNWLSGSNKAPLQVISDFMGRQIVKAHAGLAKGKTPRLYSLTELRKRAKTCPDTAFYLHVFDNDVGRLLRMTDEVKEVYWRAGFVEGFACEKTWVMKLLGDLRTATYPITYIKTRKLPEEEFSSWKSDWWYFVEMNAGVEFVEEEW